MERIQVTDAYPWKSYFLSLRASSDLKEFPGQWDYEHYYQINEETLQLLRRSSGEIYQMCLFAVENILVNRRFEETGLPVHFESMVSNSWDKHLPLVCARVKLNLEAGRIHFLRCTTTHFSNLHDSAIIQWHWLQDFYPEADQFNDIWQSLVECFEQLNLNFLRGRSLTFVHSGSLEHQAAIEVFRDAAQEAKCTVGQAHIDSLTWSNRSHSFETAEGEPIEFIYNCCRFDQIQDLSYEGLAYLTDSNRWFETLWSVVLDSPNFRSILEDLFPRHPLLIDGMADPVIKRVDVRGGQVDENGNDRRSESEDLSILSCWLVNGQPTGLGIENTANSQNLFVPHLIA